MGWKDKIVQQGDAPAQAPGWRSKVVPQEAQIQNTAQTQAEVYGPPTAFEQYDVMRLTPERVGKSASTALGVMGASALPKIGEIATKGVSRIAASGALNAAQSPEDRLAGFLTGAAFEAIPVVGKAAKDKFTTTKNKLATWLGRKMGGLSPEEAAMYQANPSQAEELAGLSRDNPMELSKRVSAKIKGGIDEGFEEVSRPALSRVEAAMAPKTIAVSPQQYKGTAAGSEIERVATLNPQTKTWNVPVEEPYVAKATPIRSEANFDFPKDPQRWVKPDSYTPIEVPVGVVSHNIKKAGPEEIVSSGLIPRGTQTVTTQVTPKEVPLTGAQHLRALRASQKAAYENQAKALHPQAYNPADDLEAVAAANLKKARGAVAPETVEDFKTLEEAARFSGYAKQALKNNPAAILRESETLGSVPMREMRQFLDKHGGAGLEDMANSLAAGQKLTTPKEIEGFKAMLTREFAKRALIEGSKAPSPQTVDQIVRDMVIRNLVAPSFNSQE